MSGLGIQGLYRPTLSRTLSMHPLENNDEAAEEHDQLTLHEPLSLDWHDYVVPGAEDCEGRPPTPLSDEALLQLPALPVLPLEPPLEFNPTGGPLTRSFAQFLHDDSKFFRPIPLPAKPVTAVRRILAVPLSSASRKRPAAPISELPPSYRAPEPLASTPTPAAPTTPVVPPAPRKKRRGLRPGSYMCLFRGELYECPHGCDIVEKVLLYDLLRR